MNAIGVFDSGVGGVTVLRALKQAFPCENFVYLGDTARLPYGTKSAGTIRKYLWQNVRFLSAFGVKGIVVACNSASSVLDDVASGPVPLIGVVKPGAQAALKVSHNRRVGVMATRATVKSQVYVRSLHALAPETQVFQEASPLLVPLVEEGWESSEVCRQVLSHYLLPLQEARVDTLILGCTHYPVLKDQIEGIMGPGVRVVDSAGATVERLQRAFDEEEMPKTTRRSEGKIHVWTTDDGFFFHQIANRLLMPYAIDMWQMADLQHVPEEGSYEEL
jgi:glutamate racemase